MFPRLFRQASNLALLSLLATPFLSSTARAQVSVTTSHNDNGRTGLNTQETKLNVSNVNVARFGKLFSRAVDGKIWCQPLYVPDVAIAGKGKHNVVYVMTEMGTVYAFDADDAAQSAPLWSTSLLPPNGNGGMSDQNVSSPVIDPASKTIYLTLKNKESNWVFRLFALDITSGVQKAGSGAIMTATVTGNAKGSVNGKLTFNPPTQKQRPSLLLQGGKIYAAFGGSVDEFDPYVAWNGWIFVYDAATLRQEQVFVVAPNGNGGGIWQAGNGLSVDSSGNIYAVTGNGNGFGNNGTGQLYSFSADTGGYDYGNSVLKMAVGTAVGTKPGSIDYGGKRLNVLDYWTPYNWKYIETADQDLGCGGVLQIPGTPYAVTGDKIGRLYTLDTRNLGKFQANSNSQIVNDFQAWKGNLHGGMVYYPSPKYGPLVYGWSENDVLKSFKVSDLTTRGASISPAMTSTASAPPGMPGGFMSISSNGTQSGSAIVWAYTVYEGDANQFIVPGMVHAFDAENLSHELWNTKMLPSRDDTGLYSKFSYPTVANGKVYVSSYSNRMDVFGLLPVAAKLPVPLGVTAKAGIQKVTLSWNATAGATCYTVKRSDAKAGPFTAIADSVIPTTFDDTAVVAGKTYYYVVCADNSGGEGAASAVVSATPFNPANGTVVSVDFNGSSTYFGPVTSMAPTETAGVASVPNWNVVKGNTGTAANLVTNGGAATPASVAWVSEGCVSTVIADTAGNNRMMKGYLSNDSETPITVDVKSLPAAFAQNGYDVYVYCDGVNPTASRVAKFTIGSTTIQTTDAENRDFEGRFFEPGVANVGNVVVFRNLNLANFTLSITHGESDDTTPRAPINGLQIVEHQSGPAPTAPPAPANLVATPSVNQVALSWNAVSVANFYTVQRANSPLGPFDPIGTTQTPNYLDLTAKNGVTYYYAVTATANLIESVLSNKVAATPEVNYVSRTLNIDFVGTSTAPMAASEKAGVIPRANWTSASGVSGSLTALKDENGTVTSAAVTWKASAAGNTAITDTAGNNRMMRGYLSGTKTAATVTVSGLPAEFNANGYDVYVYGDSSNTGTRIANYSVAGSSAVVTDTAGAQFNGTYLLGNGTSGNYAVFPAQKSATFTLSALAASTVDGTFAAPINGIQIVERRLVPVNGTGPTTLSVTPATQTTAYGTGAYLSTIYADSSGATDIAYAYLRVGTGTDDAAPLDVYYNGGTNKLYVYDGTNWVGGITPGSVGVITGPRGSLDCSKTVVTRVGTVLTVSWYLTPSQALLGRKLVICRVQDTKNQWEQWKNMGVWAITAPAASGAVAATVPSASHS